STDEEPIEAGGAETDVGGEVGKFYLCQQRAVGVIDLHPGGGAGAEAALGIPPEAGEKAPPAIGENRRVCQACAGNATTTSAGDGAGPSGDMRRAGVSDVEQRLVRREREAVGLHEVVGDDGNLAARGVDAVDVARADLALGGLALVAREDAVVGIGEPDAAVR